MGLRIEYMDVAALHAYGRNARTHSAEQIEQLRASIREFGFTNPVLIDEAGELIAGHGRTAAATAEGLKQVPAIRLLGLSDQQKKALRIADNQLALNAGWDLDLLAQEVQELQAEDYDLELLGFDDAMLNQLLADGEEEEAPPPLSDADKTPAVKAREVSKPGMVWQLGPHRVMCGDSTSAADVEKLVAGEKAQLLHADPPYGMGKASDGVANDNIYGAALDKFQMDWWRAFRAALTDNASAYIWGNAPELWSLWYRGGLADSERLELRNEIVWDKKSIAGMASPLMTQFPEASERALFFQFGDQFLGNVNSEDFPDSWEPLRSYMEGQAKAAGIGSQDVKRICGVGMYSHWFTRSQFNLIPKERYQSLADACTGFFSRPWEELKKEWDSVKGGPNSELSSARSYFDNAHDAMRDVWEFPRVIGDERHGHATPKPVAMMERVMRSSLPDGGLCLEPFGGSGSTLMGAEKTGRRCYTMELQPMYVDVIVRRWQEYTGKAATLDGDGRTFAEIEAIAEAVEV